MCTIWTIYIWNWSIWLNIHSFGKVLNLIWIILIGLSVPGNRSGVRRRWATSHYSGVVLLIYFYFISNFFLFLKEFFCDRNLSFSIRIWNFVFMFQTFLFLCLITRFNRNSPTGKSIDNWHILTWPFLYLFQIQMVWIHFLLRYVFL